MVADGGNTSEDIMAASGSEYIVSTSSTSCAVVDIENKRKEPRSGLLSLTMMNYCMFVVSAIVMSSSCGLWQLPNANDASMTTMNEIMTVCFMFVVVKL